MFKNWKRKKRLTKNEISMMLSKIFSTKEMEIDCDECFDQLDRYAETMLTGKALDEAMRLVEDHLWKCMDCRNEYELLLKALKASESQL